MILFLYVLSFFFYFCQNHLLMTSDVIICTLEYDMSTGHNLCLYQILSKYFKPHIQEFGLEIHTGEVTRKPFENSSVKLLLDLIYVPPKYYQIISDRMRLPASVAQLDAPSDWRQGGRGFNPCRGRQHSFVEIDHEIFSTVILSLPLIQEGQLSVSGERMCTILVNRLED